MGASGTFEDPEQEQQLGIFTQSFSALLKFYTKLLSFIMIFQRSDDTARFRDSGAQHRFRRVLVFSAPRPRLGFVFYILYIPTQTRASLSVGLPARLFVCLFRSVCFFVSLFLCFLHYSDRDSGSSFIYYSLQEQIRFSVEWSPWRTWRPTTPRRSSRTAPSLLAGTRSRFKNTRGSCVSACLSTAWPYSKCFKARPSHHHLLWAAPTPRRLMSSLSRNGNRRAKISGVFYFLPHLAPRTTPLRSSRESGQKMERGMDRWRGRLSLRIAAATLRRPKGRARRNSHKDGARPGLRRLIFRPGRVP